VFGSDCVIVYAQLHYLFPKPDTTLSNWKSSRQDLSVTLGSQRNKFFCFFSTAVRLITPSTQRLISSAQQDSLQYLPRWDRVNCQFPTCKYNMQQPPKARLPLIIASFTITLIHTTLGRTALDGCSARHKDLYLTTHNTLKRQASMPPAGFEAIIPVSERPQTHAFDSAATGFGLSSYLNWRLASNYTFH